MTRTYARHQPCPSRAIDVLTCVRETPGITVQAIAGQLGIGWQTVRNHLINFESSHLVTVEAIAKRRGGIPEYHYTATALGMVTDPPRSSKRKKAEKHDPKTCPRCKAGFCTAERAERLRKEKGQGFRWSVPSGHVVS